MNTDLEWFEFDAGRNTFTVTLCQPFADLVMEMIDRARAWRETQTDEATAALIQALERIEQAHVKDRIGYPEVDAEERIAKAATAFVDEQGKIATRELLERADFATDRWEDLVAAVPEGGR